MLFESRRKFLYFDIYCFAPGDTDSANKVAEKLEDLSVKDKASDDKKEEEEKKETEKKEDEKKEVKAEEKN